MSYTPVARQSDVDQRYDTKVAELQRQVFMLESALEGAKAEVERLQAFEPEEAAGPQLISPEEAEQLEAPPAPLPPRRP